MIKKKDLSQKDKKVWENFIKDPFDIYDKDIKDQKSSRKERYKFDLHGLSIEEATQKVSEIIENCYDKGVSEILLITGQGHHSNLEKNVVAVCWKSSKMGSHLKSPKWLNLFLPAVFVEKNSV